MKTSSLGLLAFIALGGCSSQTVNIGRNPAMDQNQTASAHKSPPANATLVGVMSSPKAGAQTIPIQNAQVYKFIANGEELYWAYDGEVVYVWGTIDFETGVADLILEADDFGYGWMISTASYSTLYGCSADVCDWTIV